MKGSLRFGGGSYLFRLQQRMTKMFQISFPDKDPVIVKKLPMIDVWNHLCSNVTDIGGL